MLSDGYGLLTYAGDVSSSRQAQPGSFLGWDATMRIYEVESVEVYHEGDLASPFSVDEERFCAMCERADTHTHVYLQFAKPTADDAKNFWRLQGMRGLL